MNASSPLPPFLSPPVMPKTGSPGGKSRAALRIVQVETFYSPYLERFYAARPHLATASHADQINALVAGGFSALHNIAPYLATVGYDSHLIIANCASSQFAWLRENGGAPAAGAPIDMHETLRRQIDALNPDVLYFTDLVNFGSDFIRSLKRRPLLTAGWHAAPIIDGADWSALDLFVSGLGAMREMASRLGAAATEAYMPGFPEWLPAGNGLADEKVDVTFAGSYFIQHVRRNARLARIGAQAAVEGYDCAFHLMAATSSPLPPPVERWRREPTFGVDMHKTLINGRIVFDARSDMTARGPDGRMYDVAGRETANMRLFEATGSGAFLLTERMDNLQRYFDVGKEIETYGDEGELLEKITHYLRHPEERRAVAEAGRRRCLDEHGMSRRVGDFDAILRRRLPAAPVVAVAPAKPPVRYFCTYFDSAYAVRGLAMMSSVLSFLPDAQIFALCLDETAARIVKDNQPAARIVRLSELEAFDPLLADRRASRTRIEYYFTCTSSLPRYVYHCAPEAGMVTYLDADLFFYQSPERVFDDIGDASIAVTPHRFTPKLAPGRIVFGRYNVAWVSWRNDAVGRRCLADYHADCIEWCHDRLEGDRFADQKYLDAWPARYGSVRELSAKGMNLALWNLDDCALSRKDGAVYADSDPLVFMHFHSVKHIGQDKWDVRLREYDVTRNLPFVVDELYRPYLILLQATFDRLAPIYGLSRPGDARFGPESGEGLNASAPPPADDGVRFVDAVEAQAVMAARAGDPRLEAREERALAEAAASIRERRPSHDLQAAVAALTAVAADAPRPSMLEIGCDSGWRSFLYEQLIPGGARYAGGVATAAALIEQARRRRPDLRFDAAAPDALPHTDGCVDAAFVNFSALGAVDPAAVTAEARRVAGKWCVLHGIPLVRHAPTAWALRRGADGDVAETIVNEADLRLALARSGLVAHKVWEIERRAAAGETVFVRTFLCKTGARPAFPERALLNVGCGVHFHSHWVNLDVQARSPEVMDFDVRRPLPYAPRTFDMVYHSHVLEHLPRESAPAFIADCRRVLKPGGVLRIVVPDLEQIARHYLRQLDAAAAGDAEAARRYDWIMLELLDQIGRHRNGGEMRSFLSSTPLPAEDYVLSRIGDEAREMFADLRAARNDPPAAPLSDEELGRFRRSGEAHLWMYDRFSLMRLLQNGGFVDCRVVGAAESALPGFDSYRLDTTPDGAVRKPDSLFVEARKPAA
jgi:SAM-dependent methyltransferase